MAAYISFQPSDFYNTSLWLGVGGGSGTGKTITGVGFQGDLTWIKSYSGANNHTITDSVRGYNSQLCSAAATAPTTAADELLSWNSDGYVLGVDTVAGVVNNVGVDYAGWNWKAGTTTGKPTVGETITPTGYSYNTTSGFGIYEWDGTSSAGTIAHGLGTSGNAMLIVKRTNGATDWQVGHAGFTSWVYQITLSINTSAESVSTEVFNSTAPTSTTFSLGDSGGSNYSGRSYVGYLFMERRGFSKFYRYFGNGNADGPFIYTGFRPAWIMIRRYDVANDWLMYDSKREGYNVDNDYLKANENAAEQADVDIDILSNGFKIRTTAAAVNAASGKYSFAAFAEFPIVSSNSKPTTAR